VALPRVPPAAGAIFSIRELPMHNTDPRPNAEPQTAHDADGAEFAVESRIEELENQLGALRDEQLRERAELDNQRKRLVREVEQARRFANERLLGDLLPVLDSLEAGMQAAGEGGKVREGLELTLRQLQRVAEVNGLVTVDPTGAAFNPEHHQAISVVEAPGAAPGSVVQVFQKGFLLNDRLLRPALVVVAKD
jgi:molecular chaperone GrpE